MVQYRNSAPLNSTTSYSETLDSATSHRATLK